VQASWGKEMKTKSESVDRGRRHQIRGTCIEQKTPMRKADGIRGIPGGGKSSQKKNAHREPIKQNKKKKKKKKRKNQQLTNQGPGGRVKKGTAPSTLPRSPQKTGKKTSDKNI